MFLPLLVVFCAAFGGSHGAQTFQNGSTFTVGDGTFLLNGQPFRYVSGSIHYFRVPRELWADRLQRIRAIGLNTVQFFVPWVFHEQQQGVYNFNGTRDIGYFLELAKQNDLYALVRLGPYVCGEFENGGLPWWLLKDKSIMMRTSDPKFTAPVKNWFNALLPVIQPHLLKNGGNILMLQIENGYGEFWACDYFYKTFLRDTVWGLVGEDVQLYTSDIPYEVCIQCGSVAGVYPTILLVPFNTTVIDGLLATHKRHIGKGPYTISEYYPGWYQPWGQTQNVGAPIETVMDDAKYIFGLGANFNYYMIHGGTTFEFWAGSVSTTSATTSYYTGAPISENGDITPAYLKIRDWISTIPNWPTPPQDIPQNRTKINYGQVSLNNIGSVYHLKDKITGPCQSSVNPMSYEDLGVGYGYVLYQTNLTFPGTILNIPVLKDYGFVFLNGVPQGSIVANYYDQSRNSIVLKNALPGQTLQIIVENRGRLDFNTINDYKGILSEVTLNYQPVQNWIQCELFPHYTPPTLFEIVDELLEMLSLTYTPPPTSGANVFIGTFESKGDGDTWFDATAWGKGQVYVNGFNIGRYWSTAGPQQALYIPSSLIKSHNELVVLELTGMKNCPNNMCSANIVDHPAIVFQQINQSPFDPPM